MCFMEAETQSLNLYVSTVKGKPPLIGKNLEHTKLRRKNHHADNQLGKGKEEEGDMTNIQTQQT